MLKRISKYIIIANLLMPFISAAFLNSDLYASSPASDWAVINTLHFDIYYSGDTIDLAVYTAKIAEESYVYLANYFKHELTIIIPIIIYPEGSAYFENNARYLKSGKLLCDFSKIDLLFAGSYGALHKELTHKLVHSFQYNILYDETPGWDVSYCIGASLPEFITEGMAEYLAEGYDEYTDMMIRDIIYSGRSGSLMKIKSPEPGDNGLSVYIGRSFFYFLETVFGPDMTGELLRNIRDYDDLYEAIAISAGISIKDLNAGWIDFYKQRDGLSNSGDLTSYGKEIAVPRDKGLSLYLPLAASQDSNYLFCLKIKDDRREIFKIDVSGTRSERILSYPAFNLSLYNIDLISNFPSFTKDSKTAAFVKRAGGREIIMLADISSGKIIKEIKLPFIEIKDLSISTDGKSLAFIGQSYSSSDVYIYNIENKIATRVTDDLFSKRSPKISPDNSFLVFASNENNEKKPEARNHKLIKFDLGAKAKTVLADNASENMHPDISPDSGRIIYVSNASGVYNIYCYDMKTGKNLQATDVSGGAFFPRWLPDGKNIAFTVYQDTKYRILVKDISNAESPKEKKIKDYKIIEYPDPYFDIKDLSLSDYSDERNANISSRESGTVWNNGFAGAINIEAADFLNQHRLRLYTDFLRYNKYDKNRDVNSSVDYEYSRYRPGFGLGFFYKSNPLQSIYMDNIGQDLIPYPHNINSKHYGLYGLAKYPLIKKFRFGLKASSGIYEDAGPLNWHVKQSDIYSRQLSALLNYDSLILDKVWPVAGAKAGLSFSRDFDIGRHDASFSSISINFLRAFQFDNICFFSIKGSGGKISGRDGDAFKYYLGGFNSIRGHDLFQYYGQNAFLLSAEVRFMLLDKLTIRWPAEIKFNDISLALFADFGSAWDTDYRFTNSNGEFEDIKAGAGAGLRFLVLDHLVFKLDAAWPYFYKSFGKREIVSGFELRY